MKKISVFVISVLLVFGFASTSMAWTLIYANDANGNATYGNIQTLIDAVLAGKPIRFLVEGVDYKFVMDAQTVWVRNNIVYAQNTSYVTCDWQGDVLTFTSDVSRQFYIADTKGKVIMSTWLVGEHTKPIPDAQSTNAIKWFVE